MGDKVKDISYRKRRARIGLSRQHLAAAHAADPERVKRFEARMAALSAVRRRDNHEQHQANKRWCILRTSPTSTISLADDLDAAGYDVWTPIEIGMRRARHSRDRVERLAPILPSFVFASSDNAADLLRLSSNPVKRFADFSVFHYHDRVPLIADRDLRELREAEHVAMGHRIKRLRRDRHKAEPFPIGESVKIGTGAFGGLDGVVEESDGRFTLVCFGSMRVKIDTFLLRSDII